MPLSTTRETWAAVAAVFVLFGVPVVALLFLLALRAIYRR